MLQIVASVVDDDDVPSDPTITLERAGVDPLALAEIVAAAERDLGVDLRPTAVGPGTTFEDLLRLAHRAQAAAGRVRALPSGNGCLRGIARAAGSGVLRWWFSMRVVGGNICPAAAPS